MLKDNVCYQKAFNYSIKIVKLHKKLKKDKNEYVMSKQLLKCGTSIGANLKEGIHGQSRKDFIAKFSISLKEAEETEYWLDLLKKTGYINKEKHKKLKEDLKEIIKIIVSSIKTAKENI
ncbi:MAG: four helix bundle protein [Candidatus Mcinerneyibacterium aminivorans]|jgi:four helix bundle protein|uniref:Four helix bundle protein n=1 Tax=Candidatus Mcinerneyibacterium aminivorans TaxID=2703815 RepID=A0A5D0MG88_9BACT|nr:MAG: four helix bundle protein [Candidatus Mcinerneyibacterium aminivorans]